MGFRTSFSKLVLDRSSNWQQESTQMAIYKWKTVGNIIIYNYRTCGYHDQMQTCKTGDEILL